MTTARKSRNHQTRKLLRVCQAAAGVKMSSKRALRLYADGSVTSNQTPVITTQYGPRLNSAFTTGLLFIKTKNTNGQDTVAYYHHDHLGTPVQATDKAGNIVWAASYNAFGQATIITPQATADRPTITSNLRLPGQYEDLETGLHYNWHRYYDAQTGRYVTSDPIGLLGGINRYAYVEGNPLNTYDPMGLMGGGGNHSSRPNAHNYSWMTFRCMGDCREQTMRELRCNPAPGVTPSTPFQIGDIDTVLLAGLPLGNIMTVVSPTTNTSWNLTMPGHLLHPGWVRRDVTYDGKATWVVNTGGGTGFNPLNLNTILAFIVWGGTNPSRLPPGQGCGCGK